jgi:type I restriction enzyme M protein
MAALSEKDEEADICKDVKGNVEADSDLRDHELVPLAEDWQDYVEREVKPFVPDAWVDESHRDAADGKIGRVGYELNFNRYFYKYVPPRPVAEIDNELKTLEAEIANLLKEVAA